MRPPAPTPAVRTAVLGALALGTAAVFAGALRNGWVTFDDPGYVFRNTVVARGLSWHGLAWFFTHQHGANWVPVTAASHMLDVTLFGAAPAGHHAMSVLLHALAAALAAVALHRLTGAWWRSVAVAALFAVHPLRVESVAWIAERKDVLSGVFFLLTLIAYARWAERPGPARFAAVGAAFLLGLWSKPMLVTLPFLLVVLDAWPLGRIAIAPAAPAAAKGRRERSAPAAPARDPLAAPAKPLAGLLLEKWPLVLLAAVAMVGSWRMQDESGALSGMEVITPGRRLCNAAIVYWRYLGLTAWPHGLAAFHPYPPGMRATEAAVAALALAVVTFAALAQWRKRPYLLTGWFWYVGSLVPAIGLVQTGGHAWADRFTYLPGIGAAIVVVWAAAEWCGESRARIATAVVAFAVALAACAWATTRQVAVWRDSETLFRRVLDVEGGNLVARHAAERQIGHALLARGRTAEARPLLESALGFAPGREDSLRRALVLDPGAADTRRALASLLALETRAEEAVGEYRALLARDTTDADAMVNIAWIRATFEDPAHRDGREAVDMAERARDLCTEPVPAVFSTLAAAYAEAGRFPDAVRAGERAVALAHASGQAEDETRFARQLAAYRSGRAFHYDE